jgi:polyphosphate kinase
MITAAARSAIQAISIDPYTLPIRLLLSGSTIDAEKLKQLEDQGRSSVEAHFRRKLLQVLQPYNLDVPLDVLMDVSITLHALHFIITMDW